MSCLFLLLPIFEYFFTKTSNNKIQIKVNNTTTNLLYLKGLVYYGGTLFTSRIISKDGLMMELQMEAKLFRMAIFLQ